MVAERVKRDRPMRWHATRRPFGACEGVMRRIRAVAIVIHAVGLIPALAGAQTGISTSPAQLAVENGLLPAVIFAGRPAFSWSIEDRMRRYNTPGLGIAVIHNGQIAWAAGYGVRRAGAPEAVSTSTVFQAASISKLVTATAAMRLVQAERLDLDADVNSMLRSWKLPPSELVMESPVTLRRLLSHTGGITVSGFPGYPRGSELPSRLQVLDGVEPANSPPIRVDETPGRTYRYSGGGYQIVQLLVEDVTETSLEEVARESIFRPLGMERTTFQTVLPDELNTEAVHGHRYDGRPVEGGSYLYPEQAAASLWSTPSDLARFAIALMRAFRGEPSALLDGGTAVSMLTPVSGNMALGAGVHGAGESLHFDHAGWTQGSRAYLVAFPSMMSGVVVMGNGDGANVLINEVVRSVAHVYDWPGFRPDVREAVNVSPGELRAHAGEFYVADYDLTLRVTASDDHLVISTQRGSYYSCYPFHENQFVCIEDGSILTVSEGVDGRREIHLWGMLARAR